MLVSIAVVLTCIWSSEIWSSWSATSTAGRVPILGKDVARALPMHTSEIELALILQLSPGQYLLYCYCGLWNNEDKQWKVMPRGMKACPKMTLKGCYNLFVNYCPKVFVRKLEDLHQERQEPAEHSTILQNALDSLSEAFTVSSESEVRDFHHSLKHWNSVLVESSPK